MLLCKTREEIKIVDLKEYKPGHLENAISSFLIENDILYPEDLRKEVFLKIFDIELYYHHVTFAYKNDNYYAITIKKDCHPKEQNYAFYHEFGHLFSHDGNQLRFLKPYQINYQEIDARIFSLYMAIPVHMFRYIDFSLPNTVEIVSDQFYIPESVVIARFNQIQNRLKEQSLQYSK